MEWTDEDLLVGYHTQEHRSDEDTLNKPVISVPKTSWLGKGYYFWTDLKFAYIWGDIYKTKYINDPGSYDIYKANINVKHCIDTVFSEKGYFFYLKSIKEAARHIEKKELDLEILNEWLSKHVWSKMKITGIIFDDKPTNVKTQNPIVSYYEHDQKKYLPYEKRIQVAIFDLNLVSNFDIFKDDVKPNER